MLRALHAQGLELGIGVANAEVFVNWKSERI